MYPLYLCGSFEWSKGKLAARYQISTTDELESTVIGHRHLTEYVDYWIKREDNLTKGQIICIGSTKFYVSHVLRVSTTASGTLLNLEDTIFLAEELNSWKFRNHRVTHVL